MKTKNIFLVETEKETNLVRVWSDIEKTTFTLKVNTEVNDSYKEYISVYITNDEKIKDGDWFLKDDKPVRKSGNISHYAISEPKIVLTNNNYLVTDGVQEISSEFLSFYAENTIDYVEVVKENFWVSSKVYDQPDKLSSRYILNFSPKKELEIGITIIDKSKPQDSLEEIVTYFQKVKPNNYEQEESIRQIFINETKEYLWAQDAGDCGFSEEYVFWLENKLVEYIKKTL